MATGARRLVIYVVTHRSAYRYSEPVDRCRTEAHLRPRETSRQHCLTAGVDVVPEPVTFSERLDFFGNPVCAFSVEGPFDELVVTSTSRVSIAVRSPLPVTGPTWEQARDVLGSDLDDDVLDARQYCYDSPLVATTRTLAEYAAPSFRPGRNLVDAVTDLTERIFLDFTYAPGFTTLTTPLEDVLAFRRGVCQDFAHVAIGCLRSMGLSARYVSGYIETLPPPGEERMIGGDASHAWPSVFVPGWGWFDIDPTNDQLVGSRYVTTAWGRDYSDVSPVKGIVFGGGGTQSLEVSVDVTRAVTVSS
jgi:transglutaminase-like putative cysteine protease